MNPSPTELTILKLLWRDGAKSVGEIHSEIKEELDWSRSSTRKTIERMVVKKMISVQSMHGLNVYQAEIDKLPTLATLIQNFAKTVLNLDGPLPVSNLVKSRLLSKTELDELQAYLDQENTKAAAESD